MPTRLLLDANSLVGNKTGVGNFTYRLLESLAQSNTDNLVITAYYFNFLGLKPTPDLPQHNNITYVPVRFLPTKLLSILHRLTIQLPLEFFLGFRRFDFMIFPNFVAIPSIRKTPYAVAVHDLSFEDVPNFLTDGNRSYLQRFVKRSVRRSRLVLTISEFTKERIGHYYGPDAENRTIVLPVPYEKKQTKGPISKQISNIAQSPYLLYVGTIEPRKNIENLIYGFAKMPEAYRKKYQLVLAGGLGWKSEKVLAAIDETKADITVVQTGYISDQDRDYLYKNANLVCMLSHYEGFGMPVLEAAHYNKPLLLSSIPVFHEVAGDAVTYCNKDNPVAIAAGLEKALKRPNPTYSAMDWTWDENASAVMQAIRATMGSA